MTDSGPCDLNCPQRSQFLPAMDTCCRKCYSSRKDFVNAENKHLWTKERGFLGQEGCLLSREAMPPECRAYDCKQRIFYVCQMEYKPLIWKDERWTPQQGIKGTFVGDIQDIKELLWTIGKKIEERNQELSRTTPSTVPKS